MQNNGDVYRDQTHFFLSKVKFINLVIHLTGLGTKKTTNICLIKTLALKLESQLWRLKRSLMSYSFPSVLFPSFCLLSFRGHLTRRNETWSGDVISQSAWDSPRLPPHLAQGAHSGCFHNRESCFLFLWRPPFLFIVFLLINTHFSKSWPPQRDPCPHDFIVITLQVSIEHFVTSWHVFL